MQTIRVEKVEHSIKTNYGHCDVVTVKMNGHLFEFSKYADEKEWFCDCHILPNLYPVFLHGAGSRCCKKEIASGALRLAIDEAVRGEVIQ